jgi:hypothetical protein
MTRKEGVEKSNQRVERGLNSALYAARVICHGAGAL